MSKNLAQIQILDRATETWSNVGEPMHPGSAVTFLLKNTHSATGEWHRAVDVRDPRQEVSVYNLREWAREIEMAEITAVEVDEEPEPEAIDMDALASALNAADPSAHAYVEQTGGGTATLYAYPIEGHAGVYGVAAGPGVYGYGVKASTASPDEFWAGLDDEDGSEMVSIGHLDAAERVTALRGAGLSLAAHRSAGRVSVLGGRIEVAR